MVKPLHTHQKAEKRPDYVLKVLEVPSDTLRLIQDKTSKPRVKSMRSEQNLTVKLMNSEDVWVKETQNVTVFSDTFIVTFLFPLTVIGVMLFTLLVI